MGALYIDTSALGKVLLDEPDAAAVLGAVRDFDVLVSSWLLRLELRRLGLRHGVLEATGELLQGVALSSPDQRTLRIAETIELRGVETLDAIHLATAITIADSEGLDALITYDRQLARAAEQHDLVVLAPS